MRRPRTSPDLNEISPDNGPTRRPWPPQDGRRRRHNFVLTVMCNTMGSNRCNMMSKQYLAQNNPFTPAQEDDLLLTAILQRHVCVALFVFVFCCVVAVVLFVL